MISIPKCARPTIRLLGGYSRCFVANAFDAIGRWRMCLRALGASTERITIERNTRIQLVHVASCHIRPVPSTRTARQRCRRKIQNAKRMNIENCVAAAAPAKTREPDIHSKRVQRNFLNSTKISI